MTRAFPGMANTFDYPQPGAGTLTQRHGRLIGTQIRGVESACAVMRRIIRSREGRPCRRRLLCTPLQVRRALVWQQDRWPVQLIPSTLWLGLASNPSARACDHVQRWPQPLISNYPIYLQMAWRPLNEAIENAKESSLPTFPSASRIRSRPNTRHARSPRPNSRVRSYNTPTPPLVALRRRERLVSR
jgi:hypothetical protein